MLSWSPHKTLHPSFHNRLDLIPAVYLSIHSSSLTHFNSQAGLTLGIYPFRIKTIHMHKGQSVTRMYLPIPMHVQDVTQGQLSKWSFTGLNSKFSFSLSLWPVAIPRLKSSVCPNSWKENRWIHAFSKDVWNANSFVQDLNLSPHHFSLFSVWLSLFNGISTLMGY